MLLGSFVCVGEIVTNATFHTLCSWTVSRHMFCSRENKQSRVCKIGVHYDLQNSSMFPLEVNWNTYGTCVFQLMVHKVDMKIQFCHGNSLHS